MQLGMIGPGRMGGNTVRRLTHEGHDWCHEFGGHVEMKAAAA